MDSPETSLREEVDAAGGRLEVDVEELARRFGFARVSARRIAMIDEALESAGVSAEPPLSTGPARTVLACEARARPAQRLWSEGPAEMPAAAALAQEPPFLEAPSAAAATPDVDDPASPPAWLWWTFITALVLVIAVATILGSRIG